MKQPMLLLVAACVFMSASTTAVASCGPLDDPMSSGCAKVSYGSLADPSEALRTPVNNQRAASATVPGYPSSVAPRLPNGERQCALYDMRTKNCIVRKMTPEDYDRAVNAGVSAAGAGLEIQQDINNRVYDTGAQIPSMPAAQPAATMGVDSIREAAIACAERELAKLVATSDRGVTSEQANVIAKQCGFQ